MQLLHSDNQLFRLSPLAGQHSRTDAMGNSNETHNPELVNGFTDDDYAGYSTDNFQAWEHMAEEWENFQSSEGLDGNDMFNQCLLPVVAELADLPAEEGKTLTQELAKCKAGDRVLDLGAGSGILARMFAKYGAHVTGLDFSQAMLEMGRKRAAKDKLSGKIEYDFIDLTDYSMMEKYMENRE